jgi:hypothetical protein
MPIGEGLVNQQTRRDPSSAKPLDDLQHHWQGAKSMVRNACPPLRATSLAATHLAEHPRLTGSNCSTQADGDTGSQITWRQNIRTPQISCDLKDKCEFSL